LQPEVGYNVNPKLSQFPPEIVTLGRHDMDDDQSYVTADDGFGMGFHEELRMQSLEQKHLESRRQVDAIKKAMGLGK
jgi:hypothetical protein